MAGLGTLSNPLPKDFIAAQKAQRIVDGFAEAVAEKGYEATHIEDIVRRAGVARKTLYDNFEGKGEVASALVAKRFPRLDPTELDRTLWLLTVELAARYESEGAAELAEEIEAMRGVLRAVPASITPDELSANDPLLCTLPPGRHGLPREFVTSNQRTRLITGMAWAFAERGYNATTVAHITKAALVSRRTFYEHFADKETAALALAASVAERVGDPTAISGWKGLLVEVVAAGMRNQVDAARKVKEAERVLQVLAEYAFAANESKAAA